MSKRSAHKQATDKRVIGMVHVGALPGTPGARSSVDQLVRSAVTEARVLVEAGFDGIIVENMHDVPYVHATHGPETTAVMTLVASAVRSVMNDGMALGVQVLSGGNKEAIAIGLVAAGERKGIGETFIRCENFVFSHVADEGLLARAEAGELLRYRRSIGAEQVGVWCDIKKKHASHALTADVSLDEAAEAAIFFGADALIVTGTATGKATRVEDVAEVRRVCDAADRRVPMVVGSGVVPESVEALFEHANVLIVGSFIKRDGRWTNPVDARRCKQLIAAVEMAR